MKVKNRSDFIGAAVRAQIDRMKREERNARDLAIINRKAKRLNRDAGEVLEYQVIP